MKQTGFPCGECESLGAGPPHPLYPTAEQERTSRPQLVGTYESVFQNVFLRTTELSVQTLHRLLVSFKFQHVLFLSS